MPDAKSWILPRPADHQAFERLCLDILTARKKPISEPNLFGRNGQAQHGVDFVLELADGLRGYQVKLLDEVSFEQVEAELNKTTGFPAPLREFVILTVAKEDARVQGAVIALSQRRQQVGQFPVSVVYWPTIQGWLAEHLDILKAHYPQITPNLTDLLIAQAQRLDSEFPGSYLTVTARPGHTDYEVHPGPNGIAFSATLFGKDVAARFEEALRQGTPVSFTDEEFRLDLPSALSIPAQGQGERRSLTITPSLNKTTARVRLVVDPHSAHHNMEMFARRARRRADGIPATLRFVQTGSELQIVEITPDRLPVRFVLEFRVVDGVRHGSARGERVYLGAAVEAALKAEEEVLRILDEGAYVGVFGDRFVITGEPQARPGRDTVIVDALRLVAQLASVADWDINLPAQITPEDLAEATDLLELFTNRRRVLRRGGSGSVVIHGPAEFDSFKALIESGRPPLSVYVKIEPTDVEFLGSVQRLPARAYRFARIDFPDESMDAVLAATEPPVTVRFLVPDDVEVVEELEE